MRFLNKKLWKSSKMTRVMYIIARPTTISKNRVLSEAAVHVLCLLPDYKSLSAVYKCIYYFILIIRRSLIVTPLTWSCAEGVEEQGGAYLFASAPWVCVR